MSSSGLPQNDSDRLGVKRSPANVGSRKQLFIDSLLIAKSHDIALTVNKPVKDPEPCLRADQPWESWLLGPYACVICEDGVFRMWYSCAYTEGGEYCIRLCCARSDDGLHWEKPDLALVGYPGGNKHNNIVFPPEHLIGKGDANPPSLDANPDCPADERYKMPYMCFHPEKGNEIVVYASADGLRWRALYDKPSCGRSDTNNVIFWDERIGRYVAMVRKVNRETSCWRRVGRCEFDDMRDWGKVQEVLSPDADDPPNVDIYTNAVVQYEGVYLMFPSFYSHFPDPPEVKPERGKLRNDGIVDIRFASSTDSINWNRHDRSPFIPLGPEGCWDSRQVYMCTGLVETDSEIWMYYTGLDFSHAEDAIIDSPAYRGGVGRVRLRLDGFVSADAPYTGGELTTVPMLFEGNQLVLNVETGVGGMVKVEILDSEGKPIPDFSASNCVPIEGGYIRKSVSWRNGPDIRSLAGKPVQLRFVMRDARLYSFQFKKT